MKVFIIEDEYLGLERLIKLLHEIDPGIEVLGHTETVKSSVSWFQSHPAPNLVFMDIELADGQCFEIFKQTEVLAPIIFTTSYDDYALNAFKVNSVDYLLKPVRKEELQQSLIKFDRFKKHLESTYQAQMNIENVIASLSQIPQGKDYRTRFLVKQGQRLFSIEVSDIAWFAADGKLCFIRTWNNQRYLLDYTLEQLSEMLDPVQFFRVNRSVIAHFKSVKSIQPYFGGKLILQLNPLASEMGEVLVSKERANEFKKWLGK